jgi:serine protease Do
MTPLTETIHGRRRQQGNATRVAALITAGLVLVGLSASGQAPDGEPGDMPNASKSDHVARMDDALSKAVPGILDAFIPVASNAATSVATVLADGEPVALATVVDAGGLLLTKASQLGDGDIVCHLADGRRFQAVLLGADDEQDLALLKIGADDLTPVTWRDGAPPSPGHWVITPDPSGMPAAAGVVSASPRTWPQRRRDKPHGFLGVQLEQAASNRVRIVRILPGLSAEKAGIEAGDMIERIDGDAMQSLEQVRGRLGGSPPETTVVMDLIRADTPVSIEATLGARKSHAHELHWGGGPFSERRFGFSDVLSHDTVLLPTQCGGPLLDLEGRAVGINIARALRVASYALPAQGARERLAVLEAGAPDDVQVSATPLKDTPPKKTDVVAPDADEKESEKPEEEDAPHRPAHAQLGRHWMKAIHDRDADAVAEITERFIEHHPELKVTFMIQAAQAYLGMMQAYDRGYDMARSLMDSDLKTEAKQLNEMAWFIFSEENLERRDIDCGMALARLAVERSDGNDAAILDTLARGYFEKGKLGKAIKTQAKAVKLAEGPTLAEVKETLIRYKRARRSI